MTRIAVTGTQRGGTLEQLITLRQLIRPVNTVLHHGCCIGVDKQAHDIMTDIKSNELLHAGQLVVGHPGFNPRKPDDMSKRADCYSGLDEVYPEAPFLDRDKTMVNVTDLLVAVPGSLEERLRSGTWATVRYADRIGKLVLIIGPDGIIRPYPATMSGY